MSEFSLPIVALCDELPKSRNLYKKFLQVIGNCEKTVRRGQTISYSDVENSAKELVSSLCRNANALLSLTQIKGGSDFFLEHSVNVAILSAALAYAMGYESDTLIEIAAGGLLHDIGMAWIPDRIAKKTGKLSEAEQGIMNRHPEYGLEIVKGIKLVSDRSRKIIHQHHERLSGKGYPLGIAGSRVDYFGLIAGVADTYDTDTSARPSGRAMTPQQSLGGIYGGIGQEFPKAIAEYFIKVMGVFPLGSFVGLLSGECGLVVKVDREAFLAPDVMVLFSADGQRLPETVKYSLSEKVKEPGGERFRIAGVLNAREYGVTVADFVNAAVPPKAVVST